MTLFDSPRPWLVGVVHLLATPGSPGAAPFDGRALLARAEADARALAEGGADAILVENFGDAPFHRGRVPPETVAAMALAVAAVRAAAPRSPVGVNVLRNDARAALGLCAASGATFVRVNVHTGAAVTDQGLIEGRAAQTLRARMRLAPAVRILADVHVKHATPLGAETLAQAAEDCARRGLADALVVSGSATGRAPDLERVRCVRTAAPGTPLLVGSGIDRDNAAELMRHADGAIVGTCLKEGGDVRAPVARGRVAELRALFERLRAR